MESKEGKKGASWEKKEQGEDILAVKGKDRTRMAKRDNTGKRRSKKGRKAKKRSERGQKKVVGQEGQTEDKRKENY